MIKPVDPPAEAKKLSRKVVVGIYREFFERIFEAMPADQLPAMLEGLRLAIKGRRRRPKREVTK